MKNLEHITDIPAPAEEVWAVLTDTSSYAEWNPFIRKLEGPWARGSRLAVTVKAGAREMSFRPTVLAYEEGRLIRWRGQLLLPGIVDGEHELRVEPLDDGTSRFTQHESFRGLLVPFLRGTLENTDRGITDMNEALRGRVLTRLSR
jgi:hypothetical protein